MSHAVKEHDAIGESLRAIYAPVKHELAAVEDVLQNELGSRYSFVDELVSYAFRLGGKRMRPALLLLCGKAVGDLTRDHVLLGAVIEMIHTATLVHDDVLDEAQLRRHQATINARWDNKASVLLGDYLFTHAFHLASTTTSTFACQTIGQSTNIVCEGELRQIESRGDLDLSEEEYLGIIDAKTAELCACCCRLGAHFSGVDADVVESLARYGRELGSAFQIIDDLLDLEGDEQTTGKSLGTDLAQQKMTLPLIRLRDSCAPGKWAKVHRALTASNGSRRESLTPLLAESDALEYTRQQAIVRAGRACGYLDGLPENDALATLKRLPDLVVYRQR